MATDILYYGGSIPSQFTEFWYANMKVWEDMYLDNQLARSILPVRRVPSTTEQYDMTKIDVSAESITPQGRSAAPKENLTIGGNEVSYKIYRWPTGFFLSEDDIKKSPELQGWHMEAALSKIYRAEDAAFINGVTSPSIRGLVAAAQANPNGRITQAASSGVNVGNIGAWLTSDTNRDIYQDVLEGRGKLGSKFQSNLRNLRLVGNATSLNALWQKDPYSDNSEPVYQSLAGLFGHNKNDDPTTWAIINDQVAANTVYIVTAKNPMAAELVEAKAVTIDDNYPRVPIGNFQIIVYEDFGIAIHDDEAFVEIQIN